MDNTPEKTPSTSAAHATRRASPAAKQMHPLIAALIGGTALGIILVVVTALFQHMGWFH